MKAIRYSGTPKTYPNLIQQYWDKSTQNGGDGRFMIDKMIAYCKAYMTNDMDSLQSMQDVVVGLTNPKSVDYVLSACPQNCGLDDFEGSCSIEPDRSCNDLVMCKECWNRATGTDLFHLNDN